jgi:hypothetical protein
MEKRPFRKQAAMGLVYAGWILAVVVSLAAIRPCPAVARAWSYHYQPSAPTTSSAMRATEAIMRGTPANAQQLSTARLLKQAIISDLVSFIVEQGGRPEKAYAKQSEDLVQRLSLFDRLDSPAALEELASLSGYYLGARGEEVFDCLALRKGKALEPYLEQSIHSGNAECSQKLGPSFTKPSDVLGGYALCPTDQQQKAQLTTLIGEMDAAKTCSDNDLAAIAGSLRSSAPHTHKIWRLW